MRPTIGAPAHERVKISRLGRSIAIAALFVLAAPAILPAQDARPDAGTHTVKRGDTLWDLAQTYLGDAYLWPDIYRLNTDQIDDPHWIYPGDVLRLPGRASGPAEGPPPTGDTRRPVDDEPRRSTGPTVFSTRTVARARLSNTSLVAPPRVPLGDILRAPYFDRPNGPRGTGSILFSADIPGIDRPRGVNNFQVFDRLLMVPPAGSAAAEGDRFIAYTLGDDVEDIGMVVVPSAMLRVVRAPRSGEAATVEVLELYTQLNANDRVVPLDTLGAGANGKPVPVTDGRGRTSKILEIHRNAVLPSLAYYVLFDLARKDGLHIGDEVQIYRPREEPKGDDGLILPEVAIATGQIVRVTAFGTTARITSQAQAAIAKGASVRVVARMP